MKLRRFKKLHMDSVNRHIMLSCVAMFLLVALSLCTYLFAFPAHEEIILGLVILIVLLFSTVLIALYKNVNALESLAFYDAQSGLPNTELFLKMFEQALKKKSSQSKNTALVVVSIENYKKIRATGDDGGDKFIASVAEQLKKTFPYADMICRLQGVGFVLVFRPVYTPTMVEDEIEKIITLFSRPWQIDTKDFYATIGIGVSMYPLSANSGQQLLSNALTAVYYVRNMTNDCYAFYEDFMHKRSEDFNDMKTALRKAIEQNEFNIFYQPKVDSQTGYISELEALLRWKHPEKGNIQPYVFIPIAEESGMMITIGEWTIRECCRQINHWLNLGIIPPKITINLSEVQFLHPNTADNICKLLKEYSVDPKYIGVSISEELLINNSDLIRSELDKLCYAGIAIELDNFGVNHGSINLLSSFPLSFVQIDKSITNGIGKDSFNESVIGMIIELSHSKGIKVIGSGIEHREQLSYFYNNKCDLLQGFMISWPLPSEEMEMLLLVNKQYVFRELNDVV